MKNLLKIFSVVTIGATAIALFSFTANNHIHASAKFGKVISTKYPSINKKWAEPVIANVSAYVGEIGNTVTITGSNFDNLKSVKFGTVNADVVGSPTSSEIRVKIPAGIPQGNVTVTTNGGSAVSAKTFSVFKKLLYQDGWLAGMMSWAGWGTGSGDITNSTDGVRGRRSIKFDYSGHDCPLQFAYKGSGLSLTDYKSLKLSIYGGTGTAGKKVKIELNGDASKFVTLVLSEGIFTDYVIPLADLSPAPEFSKIWIVEGSGNKGSIYIDEIGFL